MASKRDRKDNKSRKRQMDCNKRKGLARTGVERRPRTQEETQRLSHQVSLVVSLEPHGDRAADLGGLGPSPGD